MTEPANISDSYHPTAILLPFYLNGTLSDQERQTVDLHLAECNTCQQELDEMRSLQTHVNAYFSSLPQPPADIFNKVKTQILAESEPEKAHPPIVHAPTTNTLGTRIQDFLQSIFTTQWAPALAMSLILGQAGLLFWIITTSPTSPLGTEGPGYGPVIERAIPQVPLPEIKLKLRIAFEDQTPEHTIRTIIHSLKGRIVDGPTSDGIYIVEVPEDDPTQLEKIIQGLVGQKDIIRLAAPMPPSKG